MEGDTVSLRSAAAHWSLEGDSQLLSVLQSLHQTIITKCQETNSQLEAMVNALDNASIDLQNVNNKFMALSNSQFVESRVYEDEVELTDNNTDKKESSKPEAQSSLSSLKHGLQVLESLHEVVSIVDSDSEDEEQAPRRVLRPSCPRRRPRLPHIVGSQAWRDSVHAGLSSDADSDDSTDKRASAPEEYSDSDTEQHNASSSSLSSMTSHALPPPVTSQTPARNDSLTEEQIPEPELQESPQPRKLYTVQKHISAQIFPDEPPPLDRFEADSDDDIFAELHKQPYPHSDKDHNVVDDLFGSGSYLKTNTDDNDIGNIVTNRPARVDSPSFLSSVEPESKETPIHETNTESGVKKPVGGISLFGSKGSESIGAAILKRNQRQSSSESDMTEPQTKKPNIIDDLFTKPAKNIKKEPSKIKNETVVKETVNDKILFGDNIFDDIDDIFTSNVITKTNDNKNRKTIFDDDLFKDDKNDADDLFNDKIEPLNKSKETNEKVKSIFDSDSEDDLFSDIKLKDNNLKTNTIEHTKNKILINDNLNTQAQSTSELKVDQQKIDNMKQQSPNIFDDDDDESDLFCDKTQYKENSYSKTEIEKNLSNEIQYSDDIATELTRDNEVKITESETNLFSSENEKIEEKYVSHNTNIDIDISSNNAINKDLIKESDIKNEDIKKSAPITDNNTIEVIDVVTDPKVPSLPKIDFSKEVKRLENDITREETQQNHSKDMFVDIFDDMPPAFEKTVEPKKSKNVNALFDDDSDDEALFFKKDDVITDEKPDLEFNTDRFQIFHDEPPDIDIDFSQKSRNTNLKPDNINLPNQENIVNIERLLENNSKGETSIEKTENATENKIIIEDIRSENKQNLDSVNSESNIINKAVQSKIDIFKLLESEKDENIFKENKNIEDDIFSDPDKYDSNKETSKPVTDRDVYRNKDDTDSSESEKKPVGRLRPVTININVNSLLPGAIPKKSKNNEETDGQAASRSNEEYSPDVTEPQNLMTISFKGNPDSEVLDNKLSKQRAKIQVKRRPSTRRARLEAVRKSGLDFGSDSTDNSSSFDEPVKEKHKSDKMTVPYKKLKDETKLNNEVNETNKEIKEVTSKVVYILNDEDIFKVPARTDAVMKNTDNLSNSTPTKENTIQVKKQSMVDTVPEKQQNVDKTRKSLFDDMSDDDTELFKKPVQKPVFDSDSESELFCGKKGKRESELKVKQKKFTEIKVEQKVKEKKVTKSLFSDDSGDDLFGGNTKKSDSMEVSKPKPSATLTSQAFEDPLSLLGDEET